LLGPPTGHTHRDLAFDILGHRHAHGLLPLLLPHFGFDDGVAALDVPGFRHHYRAGALDVARVRHHDSFGDLALLSFRDTAVDGPLHWAVFLLVGGAIVSDRSFLEGDRRKTGRSRATGRRPTAAPPGGGVGAAQTKQSGTQAE